MFLEVEEGGQDRDGESSKKYLIRFIANLPHHSGWYRCSVMRFFRTCHIFVTLYQIMQSKSFYPRAQASSVIGERAKRARRYLVMSMESRDI